MSRPVPYVQRTATAHRRLRPLSLVLALHLAFGGGLLAAGAWSTSAHAQSTDAVHQYDIPAGPLGNALTRFSAETGILLAAPADLVQGKNSNGVRGGHSIATALHALLAGTGLEAVQETQGQYRLQPLDKTTTLAPVTVTAAVQAEPTRAYAGGQVARGGRIGMLGDQDVFDTPFSVTSYTEELIQNQQARTVGDVILNDASTRLASSSQGAGETFSIRGFNTGGSGAELYDGLPGMSHRRYSTVEKLERVEVFKGANALLTGTTGSVGGTINLVPKKPLEQSLTRLDATYESESRVGVHADVSRRFGAAEQFGIRVNGIYRDGESAFENNKEELKDLSVALEARTGKLRTSAIFDYSEQNMTGGNQQFNALSAPPAAPDLGKAIQQPWERIDSRFLRAMLKAEYDLADNWTLHAAYGATDFKGYWLRTSGTALDTAGNFNRSALQQADVQSANTGLAGIRGHFKIGSVTHKLSAEFLRTETESGRISAAIPNPSPSSNIYQPVFVPRPAIGPLERDPRKTSESIVESTAIADTLGFLNDRVLLTVGVRHQRVQSRNFNAVTGAISGTPYDKSATTPAVALLVKASDTLSLYGNYIESLESGPTAPSGTVNEGELFPPSKTKQVEVGAKLDLGKVGFTAGLFELARPSGIIDSANRFDVNGEQRHRGLELSAFGQPHPQLRVLGSATYIDSKRTKTQDGTLDGYDGVGVPDLSAVLGFEWDSRAIENLTLTGRVNYTAQQYIRDDNSQSIPSYTLYGVGARYKTKLGGRDVTIRASVENLFGKDYWTTFVGSPGLLYLGSPRRAFLSLSMDI
ncbi:TonB-dependent receptor [Oxalicibacterium flavum]|uniref:TonB-dependent receptor n=1 Tax=Oxalicibacterium flavum TaxID=179467 RepID=A0A8J2XXA6_9BURK|nr:TonB-dependent receptor [Oxalicibacterium flavum]GGB99138.1 TonB-dependent receptor [Oxalicibacterium flavum]